MPRRAATDHLKDVLESIEIIARYTKGGRDAFDREPMIRDAVCVRLIQIGQAVKDAQSEGVDLRTIRPEIAWTKISGMRDLLAHKYARLDPELVWLAVEDLPRLKTAVAAILARR